MVKATWLIPLIKKICILLVCFLYLFVSAQPALSLDEITKKDLLNNARHYDRIVCGPSEDSSSADQGASEEGEPTLRDKIAQMMFVGVADKNVAIDLVKKHGVGGIMLVNGGTSLFSKDAISEVKKAGKIEPFIGSDEEGGSVQRVGKTLKKGGYPDARALGGKSEKEVERIAKDYGEKLAELGVDINYAPVVDIDDGKNSVISGNKRAFSSSPDKVAVMAGAFAKGMKRSGVTPVFKHFPGHGHADGDSHSDEVKTPSLLDLKKADLVPYKTLLTDNNVGVMMGHLIVPALTSNAVNKQTSINKKAYDLLREDFDFNGVVFTDEIANMKAISNNYTVEEAIALAVRAGADMPLFNHNPKFTSLDLQVEKIIDRIEKDVKDDKKISPNNIDASYNRIMQLKGGSKTTTNKRDIANGCVCTTGSSAPGENSVAEAYNFLQNDKELRLDPRVAAAIVGNLIWESGGSIKELKTNNPNPSSKANGIAHWLGSRLTGAHEYASSKSKKFADLNTQLEYLKLELTTGYPPWSGSYASVLEKMKNSDSIEAMTVIFETGFERSGDTGSYPKRVALAIKVYEKYGGSVRSTSPNLESEDVVLACGEESPGSGETKGEFKWPLPKQYTVSSCYGQRFGRLHSGIDISAPRGTKILAADGGTVTIASGQGGFGNTVVIKHSNGFATLYAHLKDGSIMVKEGEKVDQGQTIGEVNNTGRSFGDHLHFNIQKQIVANYARDGSDTEDPLKHLPKDGRAMQGTNCP